MARSTPQIRNTTLFSYEEGQEFSLVVGSAPWFEWLRKETSTIFSFHSVHGSYTARKECVGNRRGGWYWKAYRKFQGRLYHAYLGKPEDLTVARLVEVAQMLVARMQEQAPQKVPLHQMPDDTPVTPLLESKLHPPRLPALLVERLRLLTLLEGGQKLTLVQAPAGFGKTTLLTQWIAHHQKNQAAQPYLSPIAWLSLDGSDNDPIRFWSSLIAACQVFHIHLGQKALAHLSQIPRSPFSSPSLEMALTFLLNDLVRGAAGVLILEDYHCIQHPRIHETLTFFIEHLPASLQVILLTRSIPPLPLVRWRARGDLLEVSSNQLRFTVEETTTFLQQVISQPLSQEAVRSLHTHLEGWVTGLRLLTLSMQSHMTPQAIEEAIMHLPAGDASDRPHRSIQEFFLSEVLAAQPEPLQLFLLQTSILSRLTGSLCDTMTGRPDSAELLEVVSRSGFFLETLENQSAWYCYHPLWAATMRAEAARRLGEEAVRRLSSSASRWYEEHSLLAEAIEASLTAYEFERAAQLIERLGETASFLECHTLVRWLGQLPDFLLRTHPELCFSCAQAHFFLEDDKDSKDGRGRIEELLQMAEEAWRKQGALERIGILSAFRASLALLDGRVAQAASYARQALQLLPLMEPQRGLKTQRQQTERVDWRCSSLMTLAMEAWLSGSFDQAHQLLLEAYSLSLNSRDRMLSPVIGELLGEVCIELGELHQAASYYQQTLVQPFAWASAQDGDAEDTRRANSVWGLIRLSYEWNKLDQAEQLGCSASLFRYEGRFSYWEEKTRVKLELARLLVLQARGEIAEVRAALSALLVRLESIPNTFPLVCEVLIWQARWQMRDGDLAAAERTLSTLAHSEQKMSPLARQSMHLLYARLSLMRGETEATLQQLERLLAVAQQGKHLIRILEIQLLIALVYDARNQEPEARHQLTLVLSQARNEGFVRLFLDEGEQMSTFLHQLLPTLTEKPLRSYARSILHAFAATFDASRNGTETSLLELLSVQERRVLSLLVAGRSNPEIAEALIVSVNTIKAHVKNLYRKLGVTNRMEAGLVARGEQPIRI